MTRWLARAALFLIAVGVAAALSVVRIHTQGGLWPFWAGNHPRLIAIIGGATVWVLAVAAAIWATASGVYALWKAAQ